MSEQQVEATEPRGMYISVEQVKAVNVLLAAVNVAQGKGAFSLADSTAVFEAVKAFVPAQAPEAEEAEEPSEEAQAS